MTLWKRLLKLSPGTLWKLFLLLARRPLLIAPTIGATRKTFRVTSQIYGKAQGASGPANAFRHGCWNVLLAARCYAITHDVQASVTWAKRVTDTHEQLIVNPEMDRLMDLHNNEVGRKVFLSNIEKNESSLIKIVGKMAENAQKWKKNKKIAMPTDQLIYLEEGQK
jgi:hypothetical protein